MSKVVKPASAPPAKAKPTTSSSSSTSTVKATRTVAPAAAAAAAPASAAPSSSSSSRAASATAAPMRSFQAACNRYSLDPLTWRSKVINLQSNPAPVPQKPWHDPANQQNFVEDIQQEKQKAEERVRRLQSGEDDDLLDMEEDEDDAEERGDHKHNEDDDEEAESEESSGSDEGEEESEGDYDNEFEYLVHEVLCLDAINHDPPSGKEVKCQYCTDGKK